MRLANLALGFLLGAIVFIGASLVLAWTGPSSTPPNGNTTKVNWSASNVSSCKVSAPNGDAWTGLQSILGGNISKPITGETPYTLTCLALGQPALLTQGRTPLLLDRCIIPYGDQLDGDQLACPAEELCFG